MLENNSPKRALDTSNHLPTKRQRTNKTWTFADDCRSIAEAIGTFPYSEIESILFEKFKAYSYTNIVENCSMDKNTKEAVICSLKKLFIVYSGEYKALLEKIAETIITKPKQ